MKVIYTSAMIEHKKDIRIFQYQKAYNCLRKFFTKDDISIVECYAKNINEVQELERLGNVFITETHVQGIRNKGVLEILGMKKFLSHHQQISDDDTLLKITGRYFLYDDLIFKEMTSQKNAVFCGKLVDNQRQIFTGCFSIKRKILENFLNNVNLDSMERNMINFELLLKNYLDQINEKCIFVDSIGIEAPIFGTGDIDTQYY